VPLPDRVSPDEAAVVFRRAAELDSAGTGLGEGLTAADLEDVGREVGLSPASVRAALAEVRSGAHTREVPSPRWGTISGSCVVRGDTASAVNVIDDVAQHNLLTTRTRSGDTWVWSRHSGIGAAVSRALVGRQGRPFLPLQELKAEVTDQSEGTVRIQVQGRLLFPSRLVSGPTQLVVAAGLVGAAAVLGIAVPDPALEDIGEVFAVTGSGVAILGATSLGVRSYRRTIAAMDAGLDQLFGRIERQAHPVVAHGPRPEWAVEVPR
jgi:hypothetical protein